MAADYQRMIRNLLEFLDFSGRAVITVGAGGGQFIEYGRSALKVLAVDQDRAALEVLRERLAQAGLADKFTLVHAEFLKFRESADIVLFEFCLHEMPDPSAALIHAMTLAPAVVVMDHWPGSEWAYIVAEEDKATAAWTAIASSRPERTVSFETSQLFRDYEELRQKVHVQGERSLARIERFKGLSDFSIPMTYGLALLSRPSPKESR
jgi:SAM-dependent methyltransferase